MSLIEAIISRPCVNKSYYFKTGLNGSNDFMSVPEETAKCESFLCKLDTSNALFDA